MSEPEIARRCPTCGASIREVALFCPQCGGGLPQPKSAASPTGVAVGTEEVAATSATALDAPKDEPQTSMSDTVAIPKSDEAAEAATPETNAPAVEPGKTPAEPRVRGAVGTKIQRATTLARDVEGDVMQRARKGRKMSSVVIDEASYDPSLRFVLVALGLFVLFVIIVLLNKVIT